MVSYVHLLPSDRSSDGKTEMHNFVGHEIVHFCKHEIQHPHHPHPPPLLIMFLNHIFGDLQNFKIAAEILHLVFRLEFSSYSTFFIPILNKISADPQKFNIDRNTTLSCRTLLICLHSYIVFCYRNSRFIITRNKYLCQLIVSILPRLRLPLTLPSI